jgi:hypothetical protein
MGTGTESYPKRMAGRFPSRFATTSAAVIAGVTHIEIAA